MADWSLDIKVTWVRTRILRIGVTAAVFIEEDTIPQVRKELIVAVIGGQTALSILVGNKSSWLEEAFDF